jgi:hypothetical protein
MSPHVSGRSRRRRLQSTWEHARASAFGPRSSGWPTRLTRPVHLQRVFLWNWVRRDVARWLSSGGVLLGPMAEGKQPGSGLSRVDESIEHASAKGWRFKSHA